MMKLGPRKMPRKFRLLVRTPEGPRLSSPPLTLVQAAEASAIYLHRQGLRVEVIPDTRSLRRQLVKHDRAAWNSTKKALTAAGLAAETGAFLVWDRPFCMQNYEPPGRVEPTRKPKTLTTLEVQGGDVFRDTPELPAWPCLWRCIRYVGRQAWRWLAWRNPRPAPAPHTPFSDVFTTEGESC